MSTRNEWSLWLGMVCDGDQAELIQEQISDLFMDPTPPPVVFTALRPLTDDEDDPNREWHGPVVQTIDRFDRMIDGGVIWVENGRTAEDYTFPDPADDGGYRIWYEPISEEQT